MKVHAIIPARGGSKGLPRKNLRPLCGRPLLAWSIDAGRETRLVNEVFVSTEDAEIAAVARQHGARVIDQPCASDVSTTDAALSYALREVGGDIIVLLQATVPVRRPGLVDACIRRLIESRADAVFTGYPLHFVWWQERGYATSAGEPTPTWVTQCARRPRRQDMEARELMFAEDGAVYATRSELLARTGSRLGIVIEGGKARYEGLIECVETARTVDIDTAEDLVMAGALMRYRHGLIDQLAVAPLDMETYARQ